MLDRIKKFSGIEGEITVDDLPPINPLKINDTKKKLVALANSIPPYDFMYLGRDRSVPLKKSVLHPEAPVSK